MAEKPSRSMRMDLPCPSCGTVDKQPIGEMISNNRIPCRHCGSIINISSEDWRARIRETAKQFNLLASTRAKTT